MGEKKQRGTSIRTMRIGTDTWEKEMPAIMAARGFTNRSQLIRELIREELQRRVSQLRQTASQSEQTTQRP